MQIVCWCVYNDVIRSVGPFKVKQAYRWQKAIVIKALWLSVVFITAAALFYKRKSIHARSIHTRPNSKVWPWMIPTLAFDVIWLFNSLRPRQNKRHFADDVFKCNFMKENFWIPIKISLKFVPEGPINNISALVQIMAWRRIGDKPLSEPMMTQFNDAYMRHSASMS